MRTEDQIKQDGLNKLNAMSPSDLKKALSPICGSSVWVEQVAATFPHTSPASVLTAMDKIWWSLGKSDYLEAFSAHPRIGDAAALKKKFEAQAAVAATAKGHAGGPAWEADEQKGADGAKEETLQELTEYNRLYEEKFGFIFLVCATGKTADEMLALLKARMVNEGGYELTIAAGEQGKITVLRWHKLLSSLGAQEDSSRL